MYIAGIEVQAIDRVYRVGQTKPVHIHRLIIKNSIEEDLYNIQQSKQHTAKQCLDNKQIGFSSTNNIRVGSSAITLEELRQLLLKE